MNWQDTPCIPGGRARYHWEHKFGLLPKNINVCHHCDHPWCKNLDHCFLGTQSENMLDCSIKERNPGFSGQSLSEKRKEEISVVHRGKILSEEVRAKISETLKKNWVMKHQH